MDVVSMELNPFVIFRFYSSFLRDLSERFCFTGTSRESIRVWKDRTRMFYNEVDSKTLKCLEDMVIAAR
jgi:hypothetical protein